MKRIFSALLIATLIAAPASAERQLIDAIAAVVDQEIILISDLQAAVGSELVNLQRTSRSQEEYDREAGRIMAAALELRIQTKILYRQGLLAGMEVTDDVIERQWKSFRESYDTEEEAMEELERRGMTVNDYRNVARTELLAGTVLNNKEREIERSIVVSETDVNEYFENNKDEFVQPERARIRQIMIRAPRDSEERTEAIARMEVLRDEIVNGASFEEFAKKYSEAPGAREGGILGWVTPGAMVGAIDEAAFSVEVGSVSEVLESQFGVHLVQVDERQEAGEVDLQSARAQIEPALRRKMIDERVDRWLSDLRKLSNVRVYL